MCGFRAYGQPALTADISYSIVMRFDGSCLVKAIRPQGTSVLIGPFGNESEAWNWIGVPSVLN
jgi:hypothetical protein